MEFTASVEPTRTARSSWVLGLSQAQRPILTGFKFGAALAFLAAVPPVLAADGCKVLLCLAAPSWRSVPECVPPVRQALHDVARGKPFPACPMGGEDNAAQHDWAIAPTYCPPQYARVYDTESGPIHSCDYFGAVTVKVNGVLFTRTWWKDDGSTVTDFSPAARAQLGQWDTRFDDDYAAWLAAQPQPAAPTVSGH